MRTVPLGMSKNIPAMNSAMSDNNGSLGLYPIRCPYCDS